MMLTFFRQGHLEMIVYLMKHGADPSSLDIEGTVWGSTKPYKLILFQVYQGREIIGD